MTSDQAGQFSDPNRNPYDSDAVTEGEPVVQETSVTDPVGTNEGEVDEADSTEDLEPLYDFLEELDGEHMKALFKIAVALDPFETKADGSWRWNDAQRQVIGDMASTYNDCGLTE
jgi:hypothetical protein